MRRIVLSATVAGLVGLVAFAIPAVAGQPDIEHFTLPASYDLNGTESGCGFSVHVEGVDKVVIQTFYDKSGNPTKVVFHDEFTGTETANDVTLKSDEHANITEDLITGTETWTGQPLRVSLPHGGNVLLDAGKIVYDNDGNVVVEHGHHQFVDGDVAEYCAAFSS